MSRSGDPSARDQPSVPAGSWRGTAGSEGHAQPSWQQGGTAQPLTRLRLRDQRRPLRVAGLLVLVLAFSSMWVYGLLFKAVKTPLIVVAGTEYEWPLPPNAWAREDVDRFQELHGKTIDVVEVSADWNAGENALLDFKERLSQAILRRSGASAVMIYISMHGVVDGNGNPCLIPPGGSPLDDTSWIRVRTLLDAIKNLPPKTSELEKILILDCNRIQTNWSLGVLDNTFAGSLKKEVLKAEVKNLVVLNSVSPGQVGWSGRELGGSAFGHFFHLALTGKADANRDRRITVDELYKYLQLEVNEWAISHRGAPQEPMLIPEAGAHRRFVVWAPANDDVSQPFVPDPRVSLAELQELWKGHDALRTRKAIRYAPVKFQSIQNRLLWLEQLNQAGRAYSNRAYELKDELKDDLETVRAGSLETGGENVLAKAHSALQESLGISQPDTTSPGADGSGALLPNEFVFSQHWQRTVASDEGASSEPERAKAFADVLAVLKLGEKVAVPNDERVASWIRRSVAKGDRERRLAEDALLAGDFEQAVEKSKEADRAYISAQEFAEQVADAYELRDQALAELPYLSKWLIEGPLDHGDASAAETAQVKLLQLIDDLTLLGEQLSQPDYLPSENLVSVRDNVDWLRELFDTDVMKLTGDERWTPETHQRMQAVLATPLIEASQRYKLLSSFSSKEVPTGPSPGERLSLDGVNSMERRRMPKHPAVQLLITPLVVTASTASGGNRTLEESSDSFRVTTKSDTEVDPTALTWAKQGEAVRKRLQELPNIYRKSGPTAGGDAMAEWQATLVVQSRQERLARSAAAWVRPRKFDPVAHRRSFDKQSLLLWHAERTLQDFRGPIGLQNESFFRVAARQYLQDMSLYGDEVPALARRSNELQTQLEDANFSLEIQIENVLLVDPTDSVQTQLILRPGNSRSAVASGRMSLFVRSADQRLAVQFEASSNGDGRDAASDDSLRGVVAFPLTEKVSLELRGDQLAVYGPRLDVVAAFRGHEVTAPWLVQTIGGVTVDFEIPAEMRTTVRVKGTRRQRKSFVFVLDCSDSMKQKTGVEATDSQRIQRLELAKSALQGMLDQLAGESDTRVGVRFFGHRVGWSTTEPVRVLRRQDYAKLIPPELAPSEDVELILPLGRFDSLLAGQVEELFSSVAPWGQTPLYRALVDAIGDFEKDDPDTEKHIIVITDGVNYQFTPSASGQFEAPRPVSINDVVAAWKKQTPFIHLVGFGIPEQEVPAAERAYRDLIARTSGTYETSAAEAQLLLRKLDQLLAKSTYEILDVSGENVAVPIERDGNLADAAAAAPLGQTLAIRPAPQAAGNYTVVCQQLRESILLRGGEAAEFELSADGRRLESLSYLTGSPRFGQLVARGTTVGDQFGVHRPVIENDGVRFEFSLQNPRQRFTARPAEIWIEVTPLDSDDKSVSSPYTFYDGVFASDVPVPLLRWLAKGWPDQAPKLRVDCWYKTTPTPADVIVGASRISNAPAERLTFAEFPGVEFQLESISTEAGLQIRVVEWHGENSAGVGTLKVDLARPADSTLPLKRVIRTFDPDKRVAAHVFTLPGNVMQVRGWSVRLTAADSLRDGAIKLAQPIELTLAENRDLLPPLTRSDDR